jgi:hypothetical protein
VKVCIALLALLVTFQVMIGGELMVGGVKSEAGLFTFRPAQPSESTSGTETIDARMKRTDHGMSCVRVYLTINKQRLAIYFLAFQRDSFKFKKRGQLFIRSHNETPSVVAMCVSISETVA